MQILPGIRIEGLSSYLEKYETLVISDTQIGYEETLNKKGILMPRFQIGDILRELNDLIEKTKPKMIIINGDIKHEFGTISETEWRNVLKLIDFLSSKANLTLIRGNHDTILGPIARKKEILVSDHILLGNIYLCHGHIIPEEEEDFKKSKIIIIGHEHPAIALKDKGRTEKYKCFLKGKFKGRALIVLPSFNQVTEGTDVLTEKLLSPFLNQNLREFEAYVAGKEPKYFGKIKDLIQL